MRNEELIKCKIFAKPCYNYFKTVNIRETHGTLPRRNPEKDAKILSVFIALYRPKYRHHYAAIEAFKLVWGGKGYICDWLGCNAATIHRGMEELDGDQALSNGRIRQPVGGLYRRIRISLLVSDRKP